MFRSVQIGSLPSIPNAFLYRYCFVQLKADADIEAVKQQISDVKFGTGKISVENKVTRHEVAEV